MKTCIFDLDGTLADTLESLTYSVRETLKEMKLREITEDQCRQFVGNGARYLIECSLKAAGDSGASRIEEGMEIYGRIFDANCTYHVTPYEGMKEALLGLKEKGHKLAVLSNKPHRQTVKVVQEMFGETLFDCIQGQMESVKRKPDPEGVYKVMEMLHAEKEECLYIGDSEVDVETAQNAGVKCIGVTWGFRSKEVLEDAGAVHIIDMPKDLLQYV